MSGKFNTHTDEKVLTCGAAVIIVGKPEPTSIDKLVSFFKEIGHSFKNADRVHYKQVPGAQNSRSIA